MASQDITYIFDDQQVNRFVNDLTTKSLTRIMRASYRDTLRPVMRSATKAARTAVPKSKTFVRKGVRLALWRNGQGSSVYIRSPHDDYYKLMFFEAGAKAGKKNGRRWSGRHGAITAHWFFRGTLAEYSAKIGQMFDDAFAKNYDKYVKY